MRRNKCGSGATARRYFDGGHVRWLAISTVQVLSRTSPRCPGDGVLRNGANESCDLSSNVVDGPVFNSRTSWSMSSSTKTDRAGLAPKRPALALAMVSSESGWMEVARLTLARPVGSRARSVVGHHNRGAIKWLLKRSAQPVAVDPVHRQCVFGPEQTGDLTWSAIPALRVL